MLNFLLKKHSCLFVRRFKREVSHWNFGQKFERASKQCTWSYTQPISWRRLTEGISNHFIEKSVSRKIFATLLLRRNWSIIFGNPDPTNYSQISFEMRECYVKLRLLVLRFLTKYRTKDVQTFGGLLIVLSLF